jgi:deoxyribonuclease V
MHEWKVTPAEAIEIQKRLREQVRIEPLTKEPASIGGCDVSMDRFATEGFAGFVTFAYPSLNPLSHAVVKRPIPFPYVPGLLSFREIPMLVDAWNALTVKPELLLVDGIGIAHPRRLGIASHLGIMLDIPTIGCAKSVLIGAYEEPGSVPGSWTPLIDQKNGDVIGAALRTKEKVQPIFISPGHRITLEESVAFVMRCVRKHKLPEPTRLAHLAVNDYRIKDKTSDA